MEERIEKISEKLLSIIDSEVIKIQNDDQKWKNHYDNIMFTLDSEIEYTNDLIADYSESKLTFNKIEQEGYLRCLKTMVSRFREYERHL